MSSPETNYYLPRDPEDDTPEQAALRREIREEALAPPDFTEKTMLDFAIEAGRAKRSQTAVTEHSLEAIHKVAAQRLIDESTDPAVDPPTNHPEGEHHD